jgi:hypothetical protein
MGDKIVLCITSIQTSSNYSNLYCLSSTKLENAQTNFGNYQLLVQFVNITFLSIFKTNYNRSIFTTFKLSSNCTIAYSNITIIEFVI